MHTRRSLRGGGAFLFRAFWGLSGFSGLAGVLLATILALWANPVRAQSAHPQDSLALVAFYHAAGGADWEDSTGWLEEPVRDWYGVDLNEEGRVVYLEMIDNALTGHISSQLGRLTALDSLKITENSLGGPIPASLGRLAKLEVLSLSDNDLTGSIPPTLGNLSNLEELSLDRNALTGSIPHELGNLSNLEELRFGYNALTGSIPSSLGRLEKLNYLWLAANDLTGSIPPALANLSNLKYLGLWGNALTGSIPSSLVHLAKLERLSLSSNELTGFIPPVLANLSNLKSLYLSDNALTGSIPPSLGHLKKLKTLWLQFNELTGPIPLELGNLTELNDLDLQSNELTGPIPASLGNLSRLQYLDLAGNALTGAIPPELGNLSNLLDLSLYDNPLAPYDFPEWIMGFDNLWRLSLGGTRLRGEIPPELGNLPMLHGLYLSHNDLEGALPGNITSAQNIRDLHISSNNLNALGDLCGLLEIDEVDITFNRLTFEDFEDLAECDDAVIVFKSSQEPDREHLATLFERTGFVVEADGLYGAVRITARRRPDLEALRQYIDVLVALEREGKGDMIPAGHLRMLPRIYRRLAERAERFSESEAEQTSLRLSDFIYAPQRSVPLRVTRSASEVTFSVDVGGEANEYQWYRGDDLDRTDDVPIAGATSDTLRVPLSEARAVYYCKITNPGVPDLTLYSERASSRAPEHIVRAHEADSLVLANFYRATGGSGWTNDRDWLKGPLGGWYGVTLNEAGRVTELRLDHNNLTGILPEELGSLAALKELDLAANKISGPLPEFLGNLTSLTYLHLGWNRFRGIIPASLGNLTRLKSLLLYWNSLSGPIPEELSNLTLLETLHLEANYLTGPVPVWLSNLTRLEYLELSRNDFSGPIPEELKNLSYLKYLHLDSNMLTGSIPASLGRLTRLEHLNLEYNALEGAVPNSILALERLGTLYLDHNRFTSLPDITGLPNLRWVHVSSNRLTFKDVEQQEHFGGESFTYAPQATVPVYTTRSASHVTFSVEVGGTANKYQWRREGLQGEEAIPGATADTLAVPLSEPPTYYWCEITNAKAPELTLYSERAYPEEIYTSSEREEDVLTFAVHANYPNPFSEATEIAFEAPEATHVRITVYDMLGRRVATAYDRTVSPGRYRVAYSAGDLAPGTYFYHVEMGRFRETRAMMLVR